jgi:hypothetical protein
MEVASWREPVPRNEAIIDHGRAIGMIYAGFRGFQVGFTAFADVGNDKCPPGSAGQRDNEFLPCRDTFAGL